jgi:hypothetical protein
MRVTPYAIACRSLITEVAAMPVSPAIARALTFHGRFGVTQSPSVTGQATPKAARSKLSLPRAMKSATMGARPGKAGLSYSRKRPTRTVAPSTSTAASRA